MLTEEHSSEKIGAVEDLKDRLGNPPSSDQKNTESATNKQTK